MGRTGWFALGIACISALLSGCRMNVITEIDSSGGGALTTEVGMMPDEVARLQSLGGEAGGGVCSAFSSTVMGGADAPAFAEEKRGQETWCVARMLFADVDELTALYQELGTVRIRELTLREGLLVYDLEIDAQGLDQEVSPAAETTWVLVLPGKIGTHNADRADGARLTWTLKPGAVTEVRASSDLFTPSLPFGLGVTEAAILAGMGCACCSGALVLVVVTIALLRRKRPPPASSADPARQLPEER